MPCTTEQMLVSERCGQLLSWRVVELLGSFWVVNFSQTRIGLFSGIHVVLFPTLEHICIGNNTVEIHRVLAV